jgi:hypothetical protein
VGATSGRARYPSSSGPAVDDAARATTTPTASVASVTDDRRHAVVRIKELAADKAALAAVGRLLDSFFHNVVDRCRVCATHREGSGLRTPSTRSPSSSEQVTTRSMTWRRRSQVYSKTLLIGRLGASAESRFTESGSRVVNLRVATNEYRKGEDGERTEITD